MERNFSRAGILSHAHQVNLQHGALVHPALSSQHRGQFLQYFIGRKLGHEAEVPHVHTLHPQAGKPQPGPGIELGRRYVFAENTEHIESIALERGTDGTPWLVTRVGGADQRLAVPLGRWATSRAAVRAPLIEQLVASSGAWASDDTFAATLAYYETPFKLNVRVTFSGDTVTYEREMHVAFGETKLPALAGRAQ